jgi:hypothetical protein
MDVVHDYSFAADYFYAADAETAALTIVSGPEQTGFETVDAKGIDPAVALGHLVALIRESPWSPETIGARLLFPPPKTKPASQDAYDRLPESSPWREGPWLEELDVETRNTLAAVDDARLPALVAQWETLEALGQFDDPSSLLPLLEDLVALARKARGANAQLYCWS